MFYILYYITIVIIVGITTRLLRKHTKYTKHVEKISDDLMVTLVVLWPFVLILAIFYGLYLLYSKLLWKPLLWLIGGKTDR